MRKEILLFFILVGISSAQRCGTTYGFVRSTGTWPTDAYSGASQWNPAEPDGLMALYNSSNCAYMSDPIVLKPGVTYQWKITTMNTWDANWGCGSDGITAVSNGANCQFTTNSGGTSVTVRFVWAVPNNQLYVTQGSSNPTPAPSNPTPAPSNPTPAPSNPTTGPVGSGKQVFAHFMIGNSYGYSQQMFQNDMNQAKAAGIDAFALNVGDEYSASSWSWNRVGLAYAAAQAVGFKCFLSFDLSIIQQYNTIIQGIQTVNGYAASYKYNGKLVVSTFSGAQTTFGYSSANAAWQAVKNSFGFPICFIGNFEVDANTIFQNYPALDGALSWGAWPDPTSSASEITSGDNVYMSSANSAGKLFLAPVSPWFYTHLSYKNYLYHCDSLWYDRWMQLIQNIKPHMIEIITWNDWGESSYIGTIDNNSGDLPDNSPNYVYGYPHTNWLDTLPFFISYYKNGFAPSVTTDTVVYWHRPNVKSATASSDPYGMPTVQNANTSPSGYSPSSVLADSVFVCTILKSAGTILVQSGSSTISQNVPAGLNFFSTGMNTGIQGITLQRNGATVCQFKETVAVGTSSPQYNFNAYVGGCKA